MLTSLAKVVGGLLDCVAEVARGFLNHFAKAQVLTLIACACINLGPHFLWGDSSP